MFDSKRYLKFSVKEVAGNSAFGHDGITGISLPFCLKHIKHNEKIWNDVVQTLDDRKHKTVVPERRKTNVVNPEIVPDYCMESFQAAVQGERTQSEHDSDPEPSGQGWELKEARVLECVGQNSREKRAAWRGQSSRKKAPEIFRGFASSVQLSATWSIHVRKLPEAGKRTFRNEWAEQSLEFTQGWHKFGSHQSEWKHLMIYGASSKVLRRDYLSIERQN